MTEWHTVTLWRGLAEVVDKYVRKGSQLYIEGSIRTREWTDKDNQKRYSTEILANDMKLLGRRSDNAAPQQGAPAAQPQQSGYQQSSYQQPSYQQPAYQQPAATSAPATPQVPDDNPDDLPF